MEPAIRISNLSKRFGDLAAVDRLDLEVPEGSVFGLLGVNGAGKTTILRMIAGLARPTAGSIAVGGHLSVEGTPYRRQIGYLSQDPAFYGWMTGREVVRYAAGYHPELKGAVEADVDRLMSLVGLSRAADRKCREYSGGMRQRLGIAAALVGRPRLLLLDEPATGLDPIGRRDVLELMSALRDSTTILYSTHILGDVERVSDRVAVIDHGRLLTSQRTEELLADRGRHVLRVELMGATASTADGLRSIPGVQGVSRPEVTPLGRAFDVELAGPVADAVLAGITGLAASSGFAVVEARPVTLDLEDVFMRLVDPATTEHSENRKDAA